MSIVENACDKATNNLKIGGEVKSNQILTDDKPPARRFGVCVKGLDFLHDDTSLRLIEWIELLLILGVEKIFFYEFTVHPNVKKVLDYYVSLEKADVTPISLPGTLPNEANLRHLFLSDATVCTFEIKITQSYLDSFNVNLFRNILQIKEKMKLYHTMIVCIET